MYATGMTLNPGRRVGGSLTRLTTKPDCPSRLSTLQSAHFPVRGHPSVFGVLLAAVAAGVAPPDDVTGGVPLSALAEETVEEADPALSDALRLLIIAKDSPVRRPRPASPYW
jgi:hypothetical protein